MKIAIIIPSLACGGAERSAVLLANELSKNNQIHFIIMSDLEVFYKINSNITIYNLNNNSKMLKNFNRIKNIRRYLIENEIDLTLGYTIIGAILACYSKIGLKNKVICCERSDPKIYNKSIKIIRRIAYKLADGFVFQTNGAKEYFSNDIQRKSVIIPNFIDLDNLKNININCKKSKKIVTVGRLEEVKNHKLAIHAFKEISKEFDDYIFEIYGDGSLYNELNQLIKKLNLEKKIFLRGKVNNVFNEIKDAELFIFTSNYEGFPNALLEAMALKLTVISTNCEPGGPKDLITNNNNGLLIEVGNKEQLIETIKYCLNNKLVASNLAENALNVREYNNKEKICNKWIEFIENIKRGNYE